ncbi:MAG: hypothetical protein Q9164_006630 [Protoblastenia rupestris]
MRPLAPTDYKLGHLETLQALTTVGSVSEAAWTDRYTYMSSLKDSYFVLVVCDGSGTVVGTGTVVAERKFIHGLGMVGHIEDIVVRKDQQGKKLGLRIIEALGHIAGEVGCYKVCIISQFFLSRVRMVKGVKGFVLIFVPLGVDDSRLLRGE